MCSPQKSACTFGQVNIKMYLPKSLFFQKFTCQGNQASTYVEPLVKSSQVRSVKEPQGSTFPGAQGQMPLDFAVGP